VLQLAVAAFSVAVVIVALPALSPDDLFISIDQTEITTLSSPVCSQDLFLDSRNACMSALCVY
jgi:hypothetical protein